MTKTLKLIAMLCAVLLPAVPALAADPVDPSGPGELIQSAAQSMLKALDANREEYRKDPKKVEQLVDEVLLPHFDAQYAARLVLAKHWRTATPEQRERFVKGFYNSLLRNYGSALAEFTGDRLKVFPAQISPDGERATVRTEVKRSNGERVPVNYTLRRTDGTWKAWDVTIEGISYVKSFREDFGSEIDARGLDAVIERLESGDVPVKKAA